MTEIQLPHYGDITAALSTTIDAGRIALTGDAREVSRQVALSLMTAGVGTVGEALAVLEHASPSERRRMLDDARTAAGLPTATALAAKASHAEQSRQMFVAAADDVELQLQVGPAGWFDPAAEALEAAQAEAEQERRAVEHARRRAVREAQLPALEAEAAAEALAWRPANLLPESTP